MVKIVRGRIPYLLLEDGEEVYVVVGIPKRVLAAFDRLIELVPQEKRDIAYMNVRGVLPNLACIKKVLEKGECGFYDEEVGIGIINAKCKELMKGCNVVLYYLGEAPIRKIVL